MTRTSYDFAFARECHSDERANNNRWYLATDETDPETLSKFRSHGAVLLVDVLSEKERRELLGWQANFGDLLALVSQAVVARSSYFVGTGMSSMSGGALNQRAALDMPGWSWTLLW